MSVSSQEIYTRITKSSAIRYQVMGKNHSGAFSFGRETNAFYINKVVILRIKIAFVCPFRRSPLHLCVR